MRTRLRATIWVGAFSTLACSERLASLDEIPLEPLCLWAAGTMGHWADGTQSSVISESYGTAHVCACLSKDQYFDEAEIDRLTDELNDELLIECKRVAALRDFDWDDCQQDHDSDEWNFAVLEPDELRFSCGGEGWAFGNNVPPLTCELGDPGCSCTVEAVCTGGSTCVDGMCQTPP